MAFPNITHEKKVLLCGRNSNGGVSPGDDKPCLDAGLGFS